MSIDQSVLDWSVSTRTPGLTDVVNAVTRVGDTLPMTVIAIIGTVCALVFRRYYGAATIGVGSLLGLWVMQGLKLVFARERPPQPERLIDIASYSFPSGHAMMAVVVLGLIAVVIARRAAYVVAAVGAVAIGWSRVYLGAHWLTDVLAGWLFGLVWIAVVVAVIGQIRARVERSRSPAPAAPRDSHVARPESEV